MIVPDSNVISELMKAEPAAEVFGWAGSLRGETFFTTAVNQVEVRFGLETMPPGRRRESLRKSAVQMFERYFRCRILPFDDKAALPYAVIVARRQKAGRRIDKFDARVASIAAHHRMAVATRDVRGFEDCGVDLINPWTA